MFDNNEHNEQQEQQSQEVRGGEERDSRERDAATPAPPSDSTRSSSPGNRQWGGDNQAQGDNRQQPGPYRQQGYSNRYDPYAYRQGQQAPPPPRPPQQPYGSGNPYQYNPGSGWQPYQQQEQPGEPNKNEWNFQGYDQMEGGKKHKSKAFTVVSMIVICVLVVSLVGVSGYGIWTGMNGIDDNVVAADGEDGASYPDDIGEAEEERYEVDEVPEITIYNRPQEDDEVAADGKMTIPQVAESVLPSVVGVLKYENSQMLQASGVGSGIIMTDDGYIITNAHVVAGGTSFKVEVADGTPYDAELVGYDAPTDLAVIKIDAQGLVPARFGDSSQIKVGETVVAIGNPASLQLKGSVTRGIVSAINRQLDASSYSMSYIQTDAAINPGNSGGALCNEYGQVIGINSSKIIAEGFEGIGFAIPISEAQPVLQDILTYGRVTGRVKLGITGYEIDSVDSRNYNLPEGIQIVTIEEGSYISLTDAQRGDVITHVDDERIYTMLELRGILNKHEVGDVVKLTLRRRVSTGQVAEFTVNVQLMEDNS